MNWLQTLLGKKEIYVVYISMDNTFNNKDKYFESVIERLPSPKGCEFYYIPTSDQKEAVRIEKIDY